MGWRQNQPAIDVLDDSRENLLHYDSSARLVGISLAIPQVTKEHFPPSIVGGYWRMVNFREYSNHYIIIIIIYSNPPQKLEKYNPTNKKPRQIPGRWFFYLRCQKVRRPHPSAKASFGATPLSSCPSSRILVEKVGTVWHLKIRSTYNIYIYTYIYRYH